MRIAGEERLIAAEDAGRYRDALGAMPPSGLPDAFLEARRPTAARRCSRASHAGAGRSRPPRRPGASAVEPRWPSRSSRRSSARSGSSAASCARGAREREWCDPDVLRRLRRASLAALRKEVEPVEQTAFARFLPAWHGVDRRAHAARGARAAAGSAAAGLALGVGGAAPPRAGLPARELLDQLCATGEVVWVGAGLDRVAVYFREDAPAARRACRRSEPRGRGARRDLGRARRLAPSSGSTCSKRHELEAEDALPALWELVWAGEVTNDAWQPLRRPAPLRGAEAGAAVAPVLAAAGGAVTATQGRWSLDGAAVSPACSPTGARSRSFCSSARASSRATASAPRVFAGGYGAVYGELRALETLGLCRRGYFVEGLGGAQFALGGAVERLRELRPREGEEPEALVLAAADPAQPYGAALPWPKRAGARAARVAGAYVVLLGGEAVAVRRAGRAVARAAARARRALAAPGARSARRARAPARRLKRLAVERFDGEPVVGV